MTTDFGSLAGGLFNLKNKTMKTLKITGGKWDVVHSLSKDAWNVIGTTPGLKYKIARCPYITTQNEDIDQRNSDEQKANAQLIAEAGTVANETGLTPRELLEQRNRFAKLCEEALPELTETLAEIGHDLSVGIDSTRLIMIIDDITEALDRLKNQDK